MTVQAIHYEGQEKKCTQFDGLMDTPTGQLFAESIAYNATAFIQRDEHGKEQFEGNPSEMGLMKFIFYSGVEVEKMLEDKKGKQPFTIPFSSQRKRALGSFQNDDGVRVYCKGASEVVFARCTQIHGDDGEIVEIDDDARQQMADRITSFAK